MKYGQLNADAGILDLKLNRVVIAIACYLVRDVSIWSGVAKDLASARLAI